MKKALFVAISILGLASAARATVLTQATSSAYACSGSSGPYSIGFPFQAQSNLVVTTTTSGGSVTTLVNGTDYSVSAASASIAGNASLTITAPGTTCPTGNTLTIYRVMPLKQSTNLRNQGPYSPSTLEGALDNIEMQLQQISSPDGGFSGTATAIAPGAITVASPITGDGSPSSALGLNEGTSYSWTGSQSFTVAGSVAFGGTTSFNIAPAFNHGASASGSTGFDLSGSSGTFLTPSGIATFGGTNNFTGPITFKNTIAATTGMTSFNLSGSSGAFSTPTGANTFGGLSNTFSNAVALNGAVTAGSSSSFNLSGSSGAFSTPTGANTFGGLSNTFTNATTFNGGVLFGSTASFSNVVTTSSAVNVNGSVAFNGSVSGSGSAAFDLSGRSGTFLTPGGVATFGGTGNNFSNAATFNGTTTFAAAVAGSGSANFDLSGRSGTFLTPTGANTFGGSINNFVGGIISLSAGASIVSVGTGNISFGTSGTFTTPTGSANFQGSGNSFSGTVTLQNTVTAGSSNNINFSTSSGTFSTPTGNVTIGGGSGTLTISSASVSASGSGAFDLSGRTGTFLTPTGTNTLSGSAIKMSSAQVAGRVVLNGTAAGTTVLTTAVTLTSEIVLSNCGPNGSTALGLPTVSSISAGTSFLIKSVAFAAPTTGLTTDVSTICWIVIN